MITPPNTSFLKYDVNLHMFPDTEEGLHLIVEGGRRKSRNIADSFKATLTALVMSERTV